MGCTNCTQAFFKTEQGQEKNLMIIEKENSNIESSFPSVSISNSNSKFGDTLKSNKKNDIKFRNNNNNIENLQDFPTEKSKYSDYPSKILSIINEIRSNPAKYSETVEKSICYIVNDHDKEGPGKVKTIFKKKIKVALLRGEQAFRDTIEKLKITPPMQPLTFKKDICIPLPEKEEEVKDPNFIHEQIKKMENGFKIEMYFKDLVKVPEISALLMTVDDNGLNSGKKRFSILNKNFKYIGINSKFIGKTFVAYFSFA